MGSWIKVKASDGFVLSAWQVEATGAPRGTIVLVQEIFGVNSHIRSVAQRLAGEGYDVLAPALFDRAMPEVELGYNAEGIGQGVELMQRASLDDALRDVDAARAHAAQGLPVAVMGFCWGGLVAWLSATRLDGFAAAVPYYPGGIGNFAAEAPRCPVLLHFAEHDDHISLAEAEAVRVAHPGLATVHIYPAEHGFNCDERGSYHAPSAAQAWERSLGFLALHMKVRNA
ncbi:dienelactone hydrolase family protein [Variovorax terrae]|uniref:Dienelactone hydrolase family protein n=1 Tax=Variovorax terrae TaxID=2923278 RepID=A0A9X1VTC7_9BURK|nr:dienelactone hydrolase family protein [Variovorax terrae]MCJ0762957.1 dienelactone hydrolase family protein [Variovorax terrae]